MGEHKPRLSPFGVELRKLRVELGLRLGDLSIKLENAGRGVSLSHLSSIERGARAVPEGFVSDLAFALGLSVEQVSSLERALCHQPRTVSVAVPSAYHADAVRELAAAIQDQDAELVEQTKKMIQKLARRARQ